MIEIYILSGIVGIIVFEIIKRLWNFAYNYGKMKEKIKELLREKGGEI